MTIARTHLVLGCLVLAATARGDFPLISTTSNETNYDIVYNSQQNEFFVAYSGGLSLLQRISENSSPIGSPIWTTADGGVVAELHRPWAPVQLSAEGRKCPVGAMLTYKS